MNTRLKKWCTHYLKIEELKNPEIFLLKVHILYRCTNIPFQNSVYIVLILVVYCLNDSCIFSRTCEQIHIIFKGSIYSLKCEINGHHILCIAILE